MSTKPLLLDGVVRAPKADDDSADLRREKSALEQENRSLRSQLEEVKAENRKLSQSIKALRHVLGPLHASLRSLFGEIELAIGEEEFSAPAPSGTSPRSPAGDPRWESYKQQFPGAASRIIDALLTHKQMTITQLSNFLRMHYDTASKALAKLREAGAVTKDGNFYRLNV